MRQRFNAAWNGLDRSPASHLYPQHNTAMGNAAFSLPLLWNFVNFNPLCRQLFSISVPTGEYRYEKEHFGRALTHGRPFGLNIAAMTG